MVVAPGGPFAIPIPPPSSAIQCLALYIAGISGNFRFFEPGLRCR